MVARTQEKQLLGCTYGYTRKGGRSCQVMIAEQTVEVWLQEQTADQAAVNRWDLWQLGRGDLSLPCKSMPYSTENRKRRYSHPPFHPRKMLQNILFNSYSPEQLKFAAVMINAIGGREEVRFAWTICNAVSYAICYIQFIIFLWTCKKYAWFQYHSCHFRFKTEF